MPTLTPLNGDRLTCARGRPWNSRVRCALRGDFSGTAGATNTNQVSRRNDKMYDASGTLPFKQAMQGKAPWWVALSGNEHADAYTDSRMVVGDRGLVVRSYDAVLNGQQQVVVCPPHSRRDGSSCSCRAL